MQKRFKNELKNQVNPFSTLLLDSVGMNTEATREIQDVLGGNIFDYSKPTSLIVTLANQILNSDDILLDFFSGSATSANAVMQLNQKDSGSRKFIMIQLPELCLNTSAAFQAGFKNICEIGKERVRRAAKKIRDENPLFAGDLGFKVFKLDTSNVIPWNPNPENIELMLMNAAENILIDRSREDLLYEILLKWNLELTLPIEEKKFDKNTIYIIGEGVLVICLDKTIPVEVADEIVRLNKEYVPIVPMQVVFRDNGFDDVTKTNAIQILKQGGIEEKSIQSI